MILFGIPLWRKRPTDEEYVARVRRGLRWQPWVRCAISLNAMGVLGVCVWGFIIFIGMVTGPLAPPAPPAAMYSVFALAVLLGMMLGFWFAGAVRLLGQALFEDRKDRLLVETWDALHDGPGNDDIS